MLRCSTVYSYIVSAHGERTLVVMRNVTKYIVRSEEGVSVHPPEIYF